MRGLKLGSAVAAVLLVAACADQTPTAPMTRGPSLGSSGYQGPACPAGTNTTPLIWKTYKGQPVDVGSVVVSNDQNNLYVSWTTTGSWKLEYTYVALLSDKNDVPQKRNGDVRLDKLGNYTHHRPMVTTFVDTVPLGSYKAGDEVIVVAPAVVQGMYAKNDNDDKKDKKKDKDKDKDKEKKVTKLAWSGDQVLYPNVRDNHPAVDATYLKYTIVKCGVGTPGDSVPGDSVPDDSVPSDSVPDDSVPGDSVPGDSLPNDSTDVPGDSTPTDTTTPPTAGGAITITFDDGFMDAYTYGFMEMQKYGIPGNIAINPGPIDSGWTGYLTLNEVNQMHAAGWAIVSHSYNHPDLRTLTDAQLEHELRATQDWIRAHGYRGANIFIVPFHSWGARERDAIKRYYNTARGHSVFEFVPDSMATYPTTNQYGLTGYEPEYAPYTTPEGRAATRALMQRAVDEGKFVDIFFHQVPAENAAAFAEMVKIMAEFKPYIKTYATLFPGT